MTHDATHPRRARDAARTRTAVLDAAEELFAEEGYTAVSLEAIGRRAGVSRGMPGYLFGSKEALYRAVLTRVLTAEADLLVAAQSRAAATGGGVEAVVTAIVDSFLDFLVGRPTFIRLVEREAAAGGATLRQVAAETPAVGVGLATLGASFAGPGLRADPASTLLSLLALCWFPLAHAETFTRALGFDPDAPDFLSAWKRHVVTLALGGLGERQEHHQ